MLVSSVKTMVTTDRPYFEIDRTCSTFGIPAMARSTGTVTYCSTSTGESAGAAVITWTWTLVTSGTASIGNSRAERTPATTNSSVAAITIARWRRDQATTLVSSTISLLLFAEGALEDGALEGEDAVDHHPLAVAQPTQDLDASRRSPAQRHRMHLEIAVGLKDEHDLSVRHLGDRRQRDDHSPGLRRSLLGHDARRPEEAHLEEVSVILDQHAS